MFRTDSCSDIAHLTETQNGQTNSGNFMLVDCCCFCRVSVSSVQVFLDLHSWLGGSSCLFCFPRLTEMGIKSFWVMIDAKKESLSIRDRVMQMPPVGRVRCLEALMAEIEATPTAGVAPAQRQHAGDG